jgi:DNA-binding transcriptional LysR family regulator
LHHGRQPQKKTGIISAETFEKIDMTSDPGQPTLDQLQVFVTVTEAGSFAAAARRLGRATSVVSYTIANLEAQLGLSLFDRDLTRKPQLTEAGRTVLAEAHSVSSAVSALRAKAKGLLQGLEAEVHVALDVMLPAWRVVDGLKAFNLEFPTVTLHLNIEALGAVTLMVLDRAAVIGISGALDLGIDGIERDFAGTVAFIPVAAPDHPLALAGKNPPGAARDHIQLVLSDRSSLTQGMDFAVIANRTWRLSDLGAKHALLKEGIGWGNMPVPLIHDDIQAGRLVRLDLSEAKGATYNFYAIHRADTPPGPAAAWLMDRFKRQGVTPGDTDAPP